MAAESPLSLFSRLDEQHNSPLWKAFDRFRGTLNGGETSEFTEVTLEAVLFKVRDLDQQHAVSNQTRSISQRLEPLIQFLDRHAKALDCMAQTQPNPSALIWGMLRIILEAAMSFSHYFKRLVENVERLGQAFALYREYEALLSNSQRFREALGDFYYNVLMFLKQVKVAFMSKGSKLLFRSLWRTFETDFETTLKSIARNSNQLDEEITMAHRTKVHESLHINLQEQSSMRELLSKAQPTYERREIMRWLSPFDMEAVYLREFQRRSQPCGQWLLCHEDFQSWLQSCQPRAIWIAGSPGCGKTVLSTSIIETIRQQVANLPEHVPAMFYCDKGEENYTSLVTILGSFIAQILAQQINFRDCIFAAYHRAQKYGRSKISIADQPMAILKDLICCLKKVYIVVDGLDELRDSSAIAESLKRLTEETTNVQLIWLSRDLPVLGIQLNSLLKIVLTPAVMSGDIDNYISAQLQDFPFEDLTIRDRIFEKLSSNANGMFLWVHLMLRTLRTATSPQEINELLCDLPIGINVIYSSILDKLAKEPLRRRMIAKRVLLWVCCSARPLHWNELASVLALDQAREQMVELKKPFKYAVLELCCPLIEYLPQSDTFRPIHLSVREFLLGPVDHHAEASTSQFLVDEQRAHHEIVHVCLAYQFWQNVQEPMNTSTTAFPFLEYATLFWCHHLSNSPYDSILMGRITGFLSLKLRRQMWILRFLLWQWSIFPLQYIMMHQRLLKNWIAQGSNSNVSDDLLDWIVDVQELLFSDSIGFEAGEPGNILSNLISKVSYFNKLMVIRDLSRECTMSGKLAKCEGWLVDALGLQQRRLGSEHVSVVWLINSLGIVYDQQQKPELSIRTHEQALAIQESTLGTDHLETIWTVNELGRMFRHLGDFAQAEQMHLTALERLRKILHPDDLQIAWTMNTLGRTYRRQRRFEEAIYLHTQALAIQQKALGQTHPHTLWATMDVAACYLEQERFKESVELYQKALDGRMQVLGPKHADTLWAMNDLGIVLQKLGEIEAAISLQQKALLGQTELLGSQHKHTVWTRGILAEMEEIKQGL